MTGCRSVKPSIETIHTVKDSSWTEIKYNKKDTIITIPGAVSFINIPLAELTEKPVTKSSGHSTVSVKRTADDIEVICECEEYKQLVSYLDKEITHLHKIIELQKELKTEPYPYVPWYIRILAWLGAITCGIVGFYVFRLFIIK